MSGRKLAAILWGVLVLSVPLFAGGIECPAQRAINCSRWAIVATLEPNIRSEGNPFAESSFQLSDAGAPNTAARPDERLLWGLAGFGLTFCPGIIGIALAGQGGDRTAWAQNTATYGSVGCLLGLSAALGIALASSSAHWNPIWYGAVAGCCGCLAVGISQYPEIAVFLFL